jgi:Putative RNA methylase family UPF0020
MRISNARVIDDPSTTDRQHGVPPRSESAPWRHDVTTSTDCTFHQLAPYIGRIKSTIASHLVEEYTRPGEVVVDPFCGSGVIPLEAAIRGRRVVAGDVNPYGVLLTRAKLLAPATEDAALDLLEQRWRGAMRRVPTLDLRRVPLWVRRFFHPETLRHALALRDELTAHGDTFLIACLLGILHHQRPGFLSYPSSHLVPYLRDKLFPRSKFPELYKQREVYPRLVAKVHRTYRRPPAALAESSVALSDSGKLPLPAPVNAVITSPPYMNELDYVRDNRLRLWFLSRELPAGGDLPKHDREEAFRLLMASTLRRIAPLIPAGGVIALVVGDASRGGRVTDAAEIVQALFSTDEAFAAFKLARLIRDKIPDLRRSRRDLRGTKRETVLVFEKLQHLRTGGVTPRNSAV